MANPMRRKLKNVINQYSDAQVKVREATSNDPWGPSSTLMSEVADLSYNVVAFSEVMQMIWKRLNDSGKNWRHVYKALVLLEYILKTGSEKVAQQCRENIYAIQTLRDFQHIEDNKDQGVNVREKAKQLVILLKDDEKLKQERAKALKAKERFAQNSTGISSSGGMQQSASMTFTRQHTGGSAPSLSGAGRRLSTSDLEQARPATAGEEELQLQLALAISKEEADAETAKKRGDDVRLALALEESQKIHGDETLVDILSDSQPPLVRNNHDEFWSAGGGGGGGAAASTRTNDPWASPAPAPHAETFAQHASNDPWAPTPPARPDPWANSVSSAPGGIEAQNDPWSAGPPESSQGSSPWGSHHGIQNHEDDDFDVLMSRPTASPSTVMNDGLDMQSSGNNKHDLTDRQRTKTPQDFLGANSSLVDIDNLVTKPKQTARNTNGPVLTTMSTGPTVVGTNPFATAGAPSNPFMAQTQPRPTLNQMQNQSRTQFSQPTPSGLPNPLVPNAPYGQPMMPAPSHNPFM